jgi:CheY-like chemotaxis protein
MARSDHRVILLAEDNPEDVIMLRRAFEQAAITLPIQVVDNGDEAIRYLAGEGRYADRCMHPLPDLLLLDLKMPRKNGFEVLQWLRQQPSLASLRVLVLTSSDQIRDVNQAYLLGANSFLVKPLDFTDFRNTMQVVYDYWFTLAKAPEVCESDFMRSHDHSSPETAS